jgi:regulator of cell morphogenesis and NO signaling
MQELQEHFIDVTSIEPKLKHPTIFNVFDGLSGGESLTIHNDHDPKPVYYQLLGERGDIFNWTYLQQGPEWWDVLVTKRSGEATETVGQLAVKDIRKAEVFKKYGIDFCCGGKKTVRQACAEKGIDATRIEQELQQVTKQVQAGRNSFNEWEIDFLCDYIINMHHNYVRKYLPELQAYATKVAQVHGNRHAELLEIKDLVLLIKQELEAHLEEEEQVLFEYVKTIANAKKQQIALVNQHQNLPVLIDALEKDHDLVGRAFDKIRTLTNGYLLPQDACASYTLLYRLLEEFEEDLHMHIHLENNLLFPKAIEMEKLVNSRYN